MKITKVAAYSVRIFICGDYNLAVSHCRKYCQEYPLCVTVTPTQYTYTSKSNPNLGDVESGIIVELINYARFDADKEYIWGRAWDLAEYLRIWLSQQSYTVQDSETSMWISHRPEDN